MAAGPYHAATAPAHGKYTLGSPRCLGDSITPASLARHLLPAQSKRREGPQREGSAPQQGTYTSMRYS